ncbi:DMT family transporter [Arenicella xantha]|uniref:S-adenosylmethionine uptake transporter n=1 Tax=Arenicella xantha TaxID=644221 RepID=A0A395JEI6_9GAMM|nr:DMT family transporter [Arenicella xantha]RBP47054.1 S-adenosylmethionine uptake transporter [Arenicella xantha]
MTDKPSSHENPTIGFGLLFALFGYAVYSSHDAVVKHLKDYHVFQIVFFAMLFSYVPFSIARIISSKRLSLSPTNPVLLATRAFLHVASLCLSFWAFSTLPMVEAYVLLFCTPLIISVLAIFFLGEKIALFRWIAIIMGLVGVIVVLRPSVDSIQVGHMAALAGAFCGAGTSVISRKIGGTENMATMIMFPLLATIMVSGIALPFVYQPMPVTDLGLMFLVGALGLLGQYSVLTGYRNAPAAFVAPMQYSQIVWAIIFGYMFFGESVDQWVLIGSMITILSGIAIIWRERTVSKVQANLKTRNGRMVGAPMMKNTEQSEEDWL